MEQLLSNWFEIITVLSVTVALSLVIRASRVSARKRADDLNAVATALERHYGAVERVLRNETVPGPIKDAVRLISSGVCDRNLARAFTKEFRSGNLFSRPKQRRFADDARAEWNTAVAGDPDLGKDFQVVLSTTLLILFLRWPENASAFESFIATTVSDQKKELAFVDFAASRQSRSRGNGNGMFGNGAVPA